MLQAQTSRRHAQARALTRRRHRRPDHAVDLRLGPRHLGHRRPRPFDFFKLKPKWGRNVQKKSGYLGGTVQQRVDDLHAMFRDPSVPAGIFCVRGGYGSAQLLDHIDYSLIRANPKIFLGYSDITALHLAINKKAGFDYLPRPRRFIAIHRLHAEVFPQSDLRKRSDRCRLQPARIEYLEARTLAANHCPPRPARGRTDRRQSHPDLHHHGHPYEIHTRGKILFIEDVDEEPYRIDRMLTQLRLAGKFDQAAGLIVGECVDCRPKDYKPSFNSTFTLGEIEDSFFSTLKIPVLAGLTIGHTDASSPCLWV